MLEDEEDKVTLSVDMESTGAGHASLVLYLSLQIRHASMLV